MADEVEVQFGETPEQVAFKLMEKIANVEGVLLTSRGGGADREWIIRTYYQCIHLVSGKHDPEKLLKIKPNADD